MCGGTDLISFSNAASSGLSQRVRGNRPCHDRTAGCRGSIPACAGNLLEEIQADLLQGSIPACAGEPSRLTIVKARARVYPRVCGGTVSRLAFFNCVRGLSPRVRGNPTETPSHRAYIGSIPACAGEPRIKDSLGSVSRVYPRVCGGTLGCRPTVRDPTGLSPRVRGNHIGRDAAHVRLGSIPACAGEPTTTTTAHQIAWVYPRVCGGTGTTPCRVKNDQGLSPRVRGNLKQVKSLGA